METHERPKQFSECVSCPKLRELTVLIEEKLEPRLNINGLSADVVCLDLGMDTLLNRPLAIDEVKMRVNMFFDKPETFSLKDGVVIKIGPITVEESRVLCPGRVASRRIGNPL